MEKAIGKARVLIEALPYVRSFRRKFVVVKLGGSAMGDDDVLRSVSTDIVFMEQVGMWPVLVHGGGARISEEMKRAGVEPRFVQGMRVTTPEVMRIVSRVLIDEVSAALCELIEEAGGKAIPLNGRASAFITATKRRLPDAPDAPDASDADLGLVGEISRVDREACYRLCDGGMIPVVASVARADPAEGSDIPLYNVNADSAASAIARELGAEKVVFMSDVPGVLRDPDDESTIVSSLHRDEVDRLVEDGVIDRGMLPKVRSCIEAVEGGVRKAHIVSALLPHALLLEIFTDKGIGTEITV